MSPISLICSLLTTSLLLTACGSTSHKPVQPPQPLLPIPTEQQMRWHELEQGALIHFSLNTYTDKEWGLGDTPVSVFDPSDLDVNQWVSVLKEVGLNSVVLVVKHYDGFCLWPSKYSTNTIAVSPYKNGTGDLVKELLEACRRENIKFGVWFATWDRSHPDYGRPEYPSFVMEQITELLINYGPISEIIISRGDGGSGDGYYGGAYEHREVDMKTYFDWEKIVSTIKKIQPEALVLGKLGIDMRVTGNISGVGGLTNWNTLNRDRINEQLDNVASILYTGQEDGSEWVPANAFVSIRPRFFYHENENKKVKSSDQLFEIYLTSVGRGTQLRLSIPPDKRGLFHENDVNALRGWKKRIDEAFTTNFALNAPVSASNVRGNAKEYSATNLTDGQNNTYWATNDNVTDASVIIELPKSLTVSYVTIKEYIRLGQRVKGFTIEIRDGYDWKIVASQTTIGYKRIVKLDEPVVTDGIRVNILASKACPVLAEVEVY